MEIAGAVMADELFHELVLKHALTRQSEEAAEGTASFLEKRTPAWYRPKV
jgi:methylglutaconyl-CoA hydratase